MLLWVGLKLPLSNGRLSCSFKVEGALIFGGDDTALNGITLFCVDQYKNPKQYSSITSTVGGWGDWGKVQRCPGYFTAFQLKVEPSQGSGDDTAANILNFKCSGGEVLQGHGSNWGTLGDWSPTCEGKGICGIQTRVEPSQGDGDDTALNDVRMFCCD
ncbi:hypothetical protein PO909_003885 [Leuciscus waleckii]